MVFSLLLSKLSEFSPFWYNDVMVWYNDLSILMLTVCFKLVTAWKMSVFGVFLVCIFPDSDWIRKDTEYLSVYSVRKWENTNQKNSEYGHFSYRDHVTGFCAIVSINSKKSLESVYYYFKLLWNGYSFW